MFNAVVLIFLLVFFLAYKLNCEYKMQKKRKEWVRFKKLLLNLSPYYYQMKTRSHLDKIKNRSLIFFLRRA